MIHETMLALKKTDERIKMLKERIDDMTGMKSRMINGVPSSGIGKLTETRAIRLTELKDELSHTWKARTWLCKKAKREKSECGDDLLWELMWDHFYHGYCWKKTAARHNMKESAVKMRFARFLKKSEAA